MWVELQTITEGNGRSGKQLEGPSVFRDWNSPLTGLQTHCIPYQLSSWRDRARTQSQVECTLKLHGQRSPKIRKQRPQFQRFVRTSSVPWRERENSSPFPPMLKSLLSPAIRLAALWVNEAFCFRKEVKLQDLSFHCFDQSLLTLGILKYLSIQRKWSCLSSIYEP